MTLCFICSGLQGRALGQNLGLQRLDVLRSTAEAFVKSRLPVSGDGAKTAVLHFTAGALDPRLRLPACSSAPGAFLPPGAQPAARTTVGLRCDSPAWTVYVPVSVESELSVLTTKRAASRGATLAATDVVGVTRRVPGFSSKYIGDPQQLAGRHLKGPVAPGVPLTSDLLVADLLVRRGQRVTLLASVGGLEVRAQGQALADAQAAQRVRVQNLGSLRVVEGVVESADVVRIRP